MKPLSERIGERMIHRPDCNQVRPSAFSEPERERRKAIGCNCGLDAMLAEVRALERRSITEAVPEGWELTGIHTTPEHRGTNGEWIAIMFNGPEDDAPMVEGTGPTPEAAVADAVNKTKESK